jgi:microcystin degradation protein MlrC
MIVVTDNDPEGAERLAQKLGQELFEMREAIQPAYLSVDEALDQALAHDGRPVVIADYADNAGGGAPSDSTFILERMLERGISNAAFGMIWDPIALDVAKEAGVGANLSLRIGGKMGPTSGRPLDLDVEVIAVVPNAKAMDARLAREIELGDVVGLRCRGIDIILNNDRQQVLSVDPFTLCGVDPGERDIVVVKSSQHFYAAYSQIASKILYAYSDGALNPILRDIPYERLPKERLWPWNANPFADE